MRKNQYAVCLVSVAFLVAVASCSDAGGNGGNGASGSSGSGARSGAGGAGNGATAGAFGGRAGSEALGGSSFAGEAAAGESGFSGAPTLPGGDGASGSAGETAAAGASGEPPVRHAHCVAKADAPCMSTATDCTTGFSCAAGTCVAGPVAGQAASGANHDQCAHGFYANPGTGGLCVARAPAGTLNCAYEGDDSPPYHPHCLEEVACVFLAVTLDTTECAGSLQQAQLCSQDSQCAAGLDCVGLANGSDARCWPHVPVGGICGPGALMSGKCAPGSYCHPGNGDFGSFAKCVAYPGVGQACDNGNCGPGLLCHAASCVAPAALGAACDQVTCAAGLACVSDSAG